MGQEVSRFEAYCNNGRAAAVTPQKVNIDDAEKSWSPEEVRKGRGKDNTIKIRSLHNNTRALRGGDWLVAKESCMTLAVAWSAHHGKKYGLTVAHGFSHFGRPVGSSIFAFDSDCEEIPTPDGGKVHKLIKIGTVVSMDMPTDSIVFEIFPHIRIDPLAVALSGDDSQVYKIVLPKPGAERPQPLPFGKKLVMYGAARRGMIGYRVEAIDRPCDAAATEISTVFATQSYETDADDDARLTTAGKTKLTFGGDCGGLYISEDGMAWCMHTSIKGVPRENPSIWSSHGSMLHDIINSKEHRFFFGFIPPIIGGSSSSSSSSSLDYQNQSSPANIRMTNIGGATSIENFPRIYFPEDVNDDCTLEYQPCVPIAHFGVVVFPPEDDEVVANAGENCPKEEKKGEESDHRFHS